MTRPVTLFTGPWTDLPFAEVVERASEWEYQGLELCCWGDHFEVQRALADDRYTHSKLDMLGRQGLNLAVVAAHRVGQAVCDPIDARHEALLPDYIWGDGEPDAVQQRAAEEMTATVRAAQKLGVGVVSGFTGSPLWSFVAGYPAPAPEIVKEGFKTFARQWNPILDVCRECGVKFALEVHPGQIAFDLHSAEMTLEAVGGREELGFTFDPSHLHWQGTDAVEFLRCFPDRIYHVHIKDIALTLNGRSSLLNSYLPPGDPRRGWHYRSPGRGGIDWEAVIRALNDIGYDGPLSVDWSDAGMDRDRGAEEACKFVRRLDFEPCARERRGSS
jgi:sugar phosphate isomerase/epimerase